MPELLVSDGLIAASEQFFASRLVNHYSPRTIDAWRYKLRAFHRWCASQGISRVQDVTQEHIEAFKVWQFEWRSETGAALAPLSLVGRLIVIKSLFKWLWRQAMIPLNPAQHIDYPRLGFRLPRVIFTSAEAEQVLSQPDLDTVTGLRNRAILEVMYSTGLRRAEVAQLDLTDLDWSRGTLLVREGKGNRDRMAPIGERAMAWIRKYQEQSRPMLAKSVDSPALFISRAGARLTNCTLTHLASSYVDRAKLGKRGSCHVFRHTMATAMLEHGADIRFIQEMLGHASLASTQVYTRVSIAKLKQVHAATHPGASLQTPIRSDGPRRGREQ